MSYEGYGYGTAQAGRLARALHVGAVAAAELGVAGGNGLLALERHAAAEESRHGGLRMPVTGFDTGTGLPEPAGYRDLPYVWRGGDFTMDEAALRARTSAELVIGDVADTFAGWLAGPGPPPGFLAFDLDYYTATAAVLAALAAAPAERLMPRVWCYFDDTVGDDFECHSPWAGELLAISEFNAACRDRKIAQPNGLRWKLHGGMSRTWVEGMHVLHLFDHPRYCDYVHGAPGRGRDVMALR